MKFFKMVLGGTLACFCMTAFAHGQARAKTKSASAPTAKAKKASRHEFTEEEIKGMTEEQIIARAKTIDMRPDGPFKNSWEALHFFDSVDGVRVPFFKPDPRDKLVDTSISFEGTWNGKPYYEYLFWCAAEFLGDVDTKVPIETRSKLSFQVLEDMKERYEADRGVILDIDEIQKKKIRMNFWITTIPGVQEALGRKIDASNCFGAHQFYQARFHPKPAALPKTAAPASSSPSASSSSAFPYLGVAGDPLVMDAKDTLIPASAGLGKWTGQAWAKSLVWCEALTLANYKLTGSSDPDIRMKLILFLGPAKARMVADHGISAELAGKLLSGDVDFFGRQMYMDKYPTSPQGADALRSCSDVQKAYVKAYPAP